MSIAHSIGQCSGHGVVQHDLCSWLVPVIRICQQSCQLGSFVARSCTCRKRSTPQRQRVTLHSQSDSWKAQQTCTPCSTITQSYHPQQRYIDVSSAAFAAWVSSVASTSQEAKYLSKQQTSASCDSTYSAVGTFAACQHNNNNNNNNNDYTFSMVAA